MAPTLAIIAASTIAFSQNPFREPPADRNRDAASEESEIPPALLLTERGRALAEELRQLRRSEETMGPRHPLLAQVRKQIASVKEQIAAWSPQAQQLSQDKATPLPDALPQMNDQEVRQLILRMAGKIAHLEQRVESLERQMEIH